LASFDFRLLQHRRRKAAVHTQTASREGISRQGRGVGRLAVHSARDINASVACANIGAFVAAAFIRSEPNAVRSVGDIFAINLGQEFESFRARHGAEPSQESGYLGSSGAAGRTVICSPRASAPSPRPRASPMLTRRAKLDRRVLPSRSAWALS
jgi:hypothetical protein